MDIKVAHGATVLMHVCESYPKLLREKLWFCDKLLATFKLKDDEGRLAVDYYKSSCIDID